MRPLPGRVLGALGLVAVGLSTGAAGAEDLAAARTCAAIAQADTRLQCYDRAFGVPPPPPAARFGDTGQLPAKVAQDPVPQSLEAKVTAVTSLPEGLYRLTLDNGQVWQTRRADWALQFSASDRVTISRLALGGYQISPAGNARSVSAKRIK
jgi:hypothetical protein